MLYRLCQRMGILKTYIQILAEQRRKWKWDGRSYMKMDLALEIFVE